MRKDSTLNYHKGYKKRIMNYEKSLDVKETKRGLGGRQEEQEVELSPRDKLEQELQEAFNQIKRDNENPLQLREQ